MNRNLNRNVSLFNFKSVPEMAAISSLRRKFAIAIAKIARCRCTQLWAGFTLLNSSLKDLRGIHMSGRGNLLPKFILISLFFSWAAAEGGAKRIA